MFAQSEEALFVANCHALPHVTNRRDRAAIIYFVFSSFNFNSILAASLSNAKLASRTAD
jgi:hypothetical protein